MVKFFFIALFIFSCLSGTPAHAQGATDRAQYFDPSSSLRFEDLAAESLQPSPAQVRVGLQTGTLWLKLSRTVPSNEALYLYQAHPSEGQINVYAPPAASARPGAPWVNETLSAKELHGGKLLLPQVATPQHVSYYVQIQIKGFQWIETDLLTQSERAVLQQREWVVLSAQLSFVALAFVGALFQLLHTRRTIYLALMGVNTLFMLYRLNLGGLLIDAWGQSVPQFLALSTAMTVAGMLGFALLVRLVFPLPGPARVWTSSTRLIAGVALGVFLLAFVLPRGPVILTALWLASILLLETAYHRGRAWYERKRHGDYMAFDYLMVVPYLLIVGACVLVFLGIYTPKVLFLTPPYLRQLDWPVMCTLLFMTLVRRHHKEAAQQQTALAVSAERLRTEVARRSEQQHLLAMLVHEIRGPLTVIQLGNRALTQRVLDVEQSVTWAQRLHSATETIGQIVENCGQVDRLEEGALFAAVSDVAIAPVLSQTLDRLRHTVPGAAERIHTAYAPESLRYASCRGDAICMGTILRNLLANALKYAPAGSAVLLQLSAVQQAGRNCVEFAVHNEQGPSGPPDPARVFERYYRAPMATQVSGTGLGLWLSQNLARQMHSEIRLGQKNDGALPKIMFSFTLELA